eukprot:1907715-Pleurochrysis_carterae.AAC.2
MHVTYRYAALGRSVDTSNGGTTWDCVVQVGDMRMNVVGAATVDDERDVFGVRRETSRVLSSSACPARGNQCSR